MEYPTKIIKTIVERIVEAADPLKIILFGSYARGDARRDSDLDFLVIEERLENDHEEYRKIKGNLRGTGIAVDLLLTTQKRFDEHRETYGMIYREIVREGKIIYEKKQ